LSQSDQKLHPETPENGGWETNAEWNREGTWPRSLNGPAPNATKTIKFLVLVESFHSVAEDEPATSPSRLRRGVGAVGDGERRRGGDGGEGLNDFSSAPVPFASPRANDGWGRQPVGQPYLVMLLLGVC